MKEEEEEVKSFLETILGEMRGIGDNLSFITEAYPNWRTIPLAELREDDKYIITENLARLLSLSTTLWQGLKGVAGATLRRVSKLLYSLLTQIKSLLIKFAKIFNIDSIVVTISLNPSIAITFKP